MSGTKKSANQDEYKQGEKENLHMPEVKKDLQLGGISAA